MTTFNELGLAKPIDRAVSELGYETPSPIQEKMIPLLMDGQDVVGIAQTGTGKTAAFMLPLLSKLNDLQRRPEKGKCDVLVLTPTRELANQILENARLYGKHIKFSACLIVGGARYEGQLRSLAKGVNLIVATPGRLMDHMETGAVDLSDVSYVVLDEADQMLDMGFVPAVRTIMKDVPEARQTVMTSATMPIAIEKLAREMMDNPSRVAVSKQSEPSKNVRQQILFVDKPQKPRALIATLAQNEWEKVIIFTRTKRGADKAQVQLIKAGFMAQSLHGDKSFGQRRHIMEEFKSGEVSILVATDLAGRGLDIDDISLVVNYDLPNIPESYVHRIGRTGRAGRKGIAISLVDRSEKGFLKDIERLIGVNLRDNKGEPALSVDMNAELPEGQDFAEKTPRSGGKPRSEKRSRAYDDAEGRPKRLARKDKPFKRGDKPKDKEGWRDKKDSRPSRPRRPSSDEARGRDDAKRDFDKPRKSRDFDKPRNDRDFDKPRKSRDFDKPRNDRDFDKPRKSRDFDKPRNDRDFDKPRKSRDFDKPRGKRPDTRQSDNQASFGDKKPGSARLKRKGGKAAARPAAKGVKKTLQLSRAVKKRSKSARKSA